MDWAVKVCGAKTAKGDGIYTSQLGHELPDYNILHEDFLAWADAHLVQTLGLPPRQQADAIGEESVPQIVNITMPPGPSINDMELAFHQGAESQKRATETVVTLGEKMVGCLIDSPTLVLWTDFW